MNQRIFLLLTLIGLFQLSACDSGIVYENYHDFSDKKWYADSTIKFTFEVIDTSKSYRLFYNVRHTIAYPYYNLYVKHSLHPSGKETNWQRQDGNLMHPTTGRPLGQGSSDLYTCRFSLFENYKFDKLGKYTFEIRQDMRADTLPEVLAVGFRLEHTK